MQVHRDQAQDGRDGGQQYGSQARRSRLDEGGDQAQPAAFELARRIFGKLPGRTALWVRQAFTLSFLLVTLGTAFGMTGAGPVSGAIGALVTQALPGMAMVAGWVIGRLKISPPDLTAVCEKVMVELDEAEKVYMVPASVA